MCEWYIFIFYVCLGVEAGRNRKNEYIEGGGGGVADKILRLLGFEDFGA